MKEEKDRNKANASPSAQPIPIPLEGAADEGWEVGEHHGPGQEALGACQKWMFDSGEHIQDLIEYILN